MESLYEHERSERLHLQELIFNKVGFTDSSPHTMPEPYQPTTFDRRKDAIRDKVRALKQQDREED